MNYYIIAKDIWNGKIKKTDTIVNSKTSEYIDNIAADSLALFVIANKTEPENLKIKFSFKGLSMIKNYKCKNTDNYSLRPYGTQVPIEPGKPFYAFAYILPYEKDGFQYYCAVEYSGKDIEKWHQEFGIEHYILFEMKFY